MENGTQRQKGGDSQCWEIPSSGCQGRTGAGEEEAGGTEDAALRQRRERKSTNLGVGSLILLT